MCSQRILIDDCHEVFWIHLIKTQKFNFTHISILLTLAAVARAFSRRLPVIVMSLFNDRLTKPNCIAVGVIDLHFHHTPRLLS
jgi:Na+(H+)/acetate symporter ActP